MTEPINVTLGTEQPLTVELVTAQSPLTVELVTASDDLTVTLGVDPSPITVELGTHTPITVELVAYSTGGNIVLEDYAIQLYPEEGMFAFDYVNHRPMFYDGTSWQALHPNRAPAFNFELFDITRSLGYPTVQTLYTDEDLNNFVTDLDGDFVFYSILSQTNAAQLPATYTQYQGIRVAPAQGVTNAQNTITVQASDGKGGTATSTFTFTLNVS